MKAAGDHVEELEDLALSKQAETLVKIASSPKIVSLNQDAGKDVVILIQPRKEGGPLVVFLAKLKPLLVLVFMRCPLIGRSVRHLHAKGGKSSMMKKRF